MRQSEAKRRASAISAGLLVGWTDQPTAAAAAAMGAAAEVPFMAPYRPPRQGGEHIDSGSQYHVPEPV